jgi:hypothetical protein
MDACQNSNNISVSENVNNEEKGIEKTIFPKGHFAPPRHARAL